LGDQIGRVKDDSGFACPIEAKNFCGRAAGGVERAFGIEAKRPEIRGIGVGEESKFWSELEAAVAANGNTVGGAFEEFFVRGLEPAAGVFGEKRRRKEVQEAKEVQEVKEKRVVNGEWRVASRRMNALIASRNDAGKEFTSLTKTGHWHGHRIWRLREIIPVTGPPSGMEDSLARDSRRT